MASKARAYAEQARADYDAYIAAGEVTVLAIGKHHRLHLPQMALEKLSKAFLFHAEPDVRYSHPVVLSAINRLRSHTIAEATGMRLSNFIRMLDSVKPIFLPLDSSIG
jgi:hypothetical protein